MTIVFDICRPEQLYIPGRGCGGHSQVILWEKINENTDFKLPLANNFYYSRKKFLPPHCPHCYSFHHDNHVIRARHCPGVPGPGTLNPHRRVICKHFPGRRGYGRDSGDPGIPLAGGCRVFAGPGRGESGGTEAGHILAWGGSAVRPGCGHL